MILAAEQYASRLVVPSSQQHPPMRWGSHKDQARKALTKLAGPHPPASLKQLEKAVGKAKADHDQATRRPARDPTTPTDVEAPVAHGDVDEVEVNGQLAVAAIVEDEDVDDAKEHELVDDGEPVHVGGVLGPDGNVYSDADPGL